MSAPILKRVRLWTMAAAVAIALWLNGQRETDFVLGFLGAATWTVLGFWAVEALVRHALLPGERPKDRRAIALLLVAKAALYGVALWVLVKELAPPTSLLLGFSLLLIVLVVVAIATRPSLGPTRPAERGNDD